MRKIPVFEPEITKDDVDYVTNILREGQISGRTNVVSLFEASFAGYCGTDYGIAVNSGSSALFLALKALDLGQGAKVIVPSFGYIAVPNAVIQAGYTPIFVDVEKTTGNLSLAELRRVLTKWSDIRGMVVIHTYGFPAKMRSIMKMAEDYEIKVIEDAAEAHGADIDGQKVGSFGHMGVFSFFANKTITTGEGGMVVTDDEVYANRVRLLKDQYAGPVRYYHEEMGYSLCMPSMSAALGISQLSRIESILEAKRAMAAYYYRNLETNNVIPLVGDLESNPIWWAFGVLSARRGELMDHLHQYGIESRPFFTAYHNNPPYKLHHPQPNAEYLQTHGLYLPSSHSLTHKDQAYVCEVINDFR